MKKREEIEARNRLDGLVYQMEKTLNDNREKVGAVAGEVETAIAEGKNYNDAAKDIKLPKYESWGGYEPFLPMNIERYYDFINRGI